MHGIGGSTIAEAKERISITEYYQWARFRNKRGRLNDGFRLEVAIARLSAMFANVNSKNGGFTANDFAPFMDAPELTLEQAMNTWS